MARLTLSSTIKLSSGYEIPALGLGVYQNHSCIPAVEAALKHGYRFVSLSFTSTQQFILINSYCVAKDISTPRKCIGTKLMLEKLSSSVVWRERISSWVSAVIVSEGILFLWIDSNAARICFFYLLLFSWARLCWYEIYAAGYLPFAEALNLSRLSA